MQIILLVVGKTRAPYVIKGIEEYSGRLRHYIKFSLIELQDIKNSKSLTVSEQKEREGNDILARILPSDYVVILDERGSEFTSLEFASYIEKLSISGRKRIVFIVGGPYGFSEQVYKRGDAKLSLSKMTFNHEMIRLCFTEQLYRAMTILRGEPYHHA